MHITLDTIFVEYLIRHVSHNTLVAQQRVRKYALIIDRMLILLCLTYAPVNFKLTILGVAATAYELRYPELDTPLPLLLVIEFMLARANVPFEGFVFVALKDDKFIFKLLSEYVIMFGTHLFERQHIVVQFGDYASSIETSQKDELFVLFAIHYLRVNTTQGAHYRYEQRRLFWVT